MRLAPYVDAERDRIVATLFDWLRIPSISAHPERTGDVRASAELCARLLTEAGMEHVQLLETPGHPAVYADWLLEHGDPAGQHRDMEVRGEDVLQLAAVVHQDRHGPEQADDEDGEQLFREVVAERLAVVVMTVGHDALL